MPPSCAAISSTALADQGFVTRSLTPDAERDLRGLVWVYVVILVALISLLVLTEMHQPR